jgi:DNA-binding GntR family transcriptional regulator
LSDQLQSEVPGELVRTARATPGDRTNLDDQIYERVRSMIANRALLPGERIVPDQLARTMRVSRTPMISALKRLSQEQLLEWRSRHGVYVRKPTPRELALIFEVREVLEGLAARRAASVITPGQIEHLRGLFKDLSTVDSPANREYYIRQDYLFHMGLFEIADSAPLSRSMATVNIMVMAFAAGLLRPMRDVLDEHEKILDTLTRRDPADAEGAMRMHINRSVVWLHHAADTYASAQNRLARELEYGVRS